MIEALVAIRVLLNELTGLGEKAVYFAGDYDNTGVWQQLGSQDRWTAVLEVMKEHVTRAHKRITAGESVIESLCDAQASLRGSAEIYRHGAKHLLRCRNLNLHNFLNNVRYENPWLTDCITRRVKLAVSINDRTSCLLDCIDALGAALPLRGLSRLSRTYKKLIEENERTIKGLVIEDLEGGGIPRATSGVGEWT